MNTLSIPEQPLDQTMRVASPAPPGVDYLDQNELREAFRKLWRRRGLIFATMAILSTLGAVQVSQIPPRFDATAMIMIDPRPNGAVSLEAMLTGGSRDSEAIYTEASVLSSRALVGKLVDRLHLETWPAVNPALAQPTLWQKVNPMTVIGDLVPKNVARALKGKPGAPPSAERIREAQRDALIDEVLGHLQISPKPRTRVLSVTIELTDAEAAAKVCNGLIELYLVDQLESKFEATERVTTWLDAQLMELRKKVDASDRAVQEYRASADLYGGKTSASVESQVAALSTQLAVDRTERAAAEERLANFRDSMHASEGSTAISEVLDSPLIQHLREQESEAQRNISDLSTQFGERHPKLIAARAHLADVQARIREEAKQHLTSLENEVAVDRTRETAVASQIDDLKRKMVSWNNAEVQLRALEMEAAANRTLMETFLSQFKQTSAQEKGGIQTPDARIISSASVPSGPSAPNKRSFMAIVVLVSGLVGVALALLAEYLDRGFRSGVQFEHHTGVPVLAMIPLVPKEKGATADHMLDRPISAYAEAIRSVYASLLLGSTETPLRTIVVASSNPREGKSTLALSLCRMMALNGHRVVLVETDLRHPSIHDLLGIPRRIGLAEVLLGKAQLEDGLFRDPRSSADVLLTGLETINPSTLLASHQMGALLDQLAQRYDRVIIDTAPVLVVSDGWLLSNKADATIFTCQWAATSRETARLGLKELRMAKANIIGAVLSAVDTKKIMSYGYADAVNYYSKSRYYVE